MKKNLYSFLDLLVLNNIDEIFVIRKYLQISIKFSDICIFQNNTNLKIRYL